MATHSSILAQKIPWTEEPGRLQSMGLQESDMTELSTRTHCRPCVRGWLVGRISDRAVVLRQE